MRRDVRRSNEVRRNPSRSPERETLPAAAELRDSTVVGPNRGPSARPEKKKTTDFTSGDTHVKINRNRNHIETASYVANVYSDA